jgi:hypothetical protein
LCIRYDMTWHDLQNNTLSINFVSNYIIYGYKQVFFIINLHYKDNKIIAKLLATKVKFEF